MLGMIAAVAVPHRSLGELRGAWLHETLDGPPDNTVRGAAPLSGTSSDVYLSNTALYSDPDLEEGVDYARRYRREVMFDDSPAGIHAFAKSTVIAPHGGGIEVGTSELCLAVAGYHPASLSTTPAGGPTYDHWMFEGLRSSNNAALHVTSTHCDDGVAVSLCAGARNVLALHGCTPAQAGLADGTQAVLVGGRNTMFRQHLLAEYDTAGFQAIDATDHAALGGTSPDNITNRTLLAMGGQLEITTPLRAAMFGVNTRAQRKHTTTPVFWSFVRAARAAIARVEANQTIL